MTQRERALRAAYRATRIPMGVYAVRLKEGGLCFLAAAANLKGGMNGVRFRLDGGIHSCRPLQALWNEKGPDAFEIVEIERLPYDKDEAKTDYAEDLRALRDIWAEKLAAAPGTRVLIG